MSFSVINNLGIPSYELQINFGVLQIDTENSATGHMDKNFPAYIAVLQCDVSFMTRISKYLSLKYFFLLFQTIEFFSFLGGFIGIWLGVSLIAVFDFLESLSTFLVFLFDRMKNSNQVTELRSAIGSRIRSRSNSTFSTDSSPWGKPSQNPNNLMVNSVRRITRTPWQNIRPFHFVYFIHAL